MSGQSREQVVTGLSNDPRVQMALLDYFGRLDRKEHVDPDAFLAMHTDIADELRSVIGVDGVARQPGPRSEFLCLQLESSRSATRAKIAAGALRVRVRELPEPSSDA